MINKISHSIIQNKRSDKFSDDQWIMNTIYVNAYKKYIYSNIILFSNINCNIVYV